MVDKYGRYGKMFQTKIVLFGGGHKKVPLICPWVASLRSGQGHINFLNEIFFDHIFDTRI